MMNHSGRHAREVHRDGASSRPQPAGECAPTKYIWTRHHQTHMPFHAPINRSEGAFWRVGVHSHIFISTAINGEESGATATKGETNIYCSTLPAKGRNNTNRIIGCTNTSKLQRKKKKIIVYTAGIFNTRLRHDGLPSAKTKRMQTSANIQTETQINGCLLYSISCAYICVCGCCCGGVRACMKWSAPNMNEGRGQMNCCFVLNIGCTSRGPTILLVCGDLSFLYCYFAFLLPCALHLFSCVCVCVCTLREGCRHDGPLSPCVHAVEPCVPLLFASPSSMCVLVLRQGCVCVHVAVDWSVCRAWCAAYGACLAAALSSCGVPSVCVCRTSRLPCCSPCPSLCRSAPHH
ncbi:hypothetical protein ECC02_002290 [Trypanosoma cruzi]|uniref:Mucin TcMUC n=1 Tax=Trypanosoma cruzi TaxID=5693 RepID=A0A7J6YEE4_TRYCR|nr:hypothetical protein ECC02_002290 [Trypanosoma cruzi]